MLHTIYRICDLRDGRTKIARITKRRCFENFVAVFGTERLTVVADNCRPETVAYLEKFSADIHRTALGNSASFRYALDLALKLPRQDSVYLVEDDYLHRPGGPVFLREGLERADYVSLYDHADKYANPSPNPLVRDGGETVRVLLTASTHWKQTNSTTMTFAARVQTLIEDAPVLRKYCRPAVPVDFFLFHELMGRGRTLITPIPGRATHCDHYPSPFIFDGPLPGLDSGSSPGGRRPEQAAPLHGERGPGPEARMAQDDGRFRLPVPTIIPFFRRQDQLNRCLAALRTQSWPVEIFVRDNSADNIYFTAAVNEGLARFLDRPVDYLLVLNQDMYLEPDAVERMVAFMDAHPRCGIGAPLQLHPDSKDYVIWGGSFEAFPAGRHDHGPLTRFLEDAPVTWANGACMILRKQMVREIGLLDANLVFIASDSDYSFTARSRGWEVWRIAGARGVHEHGASGKTAVPAVEILKLKDMRYFYRKWISGGLYRELDRQAALLPPDRAEALDRQMAEAIERRTGSEIRQ